jgi:hypothetical protein
MIFQRKKPAVHGVKAHYPGAGGYMTIVENWRQLPDGQVQFTMRRLPAAD